MEAKEMKAVTIPPMTHPLGKHWDQPDRSKIVIDEKCAIMSEQTMNELMDYSHSTPTAVYEGKMWRSQYNENGKIINYLHWWGESDNPDKCRHNIRTILIV